MDFSKSRFRVVGVDGSTIGMIDHDEYVRNGAQLIYRIDGDEVYTAGVNAKLVGSLDRNVATSYAGKILFTIQAE